MALQGGVSSATIVKGPVEAIRAEVAQRLWQLGREGGYFCGRIRACRGLLRTFRRCTMRWPSWDTTL
jgi:hypothetical protein